MKVAFDISILGAEERTPQNRTGIYKAVEALLKQLIVLRQRGKAADLDLSVFSSDLCQIETSRQVWRTLLLALGQSPQAVPFIEPPPLSWLQKIVLGLSEQKTINKSQKKASFIAVVLLALFRPVMKREMEQYSKKMAHAIPLGSVVHIPFTRDVDKFPVAPHLIRVLTCYDLTPIVCEAHVLAKPKEKLKSEAVLRLLNSQDFVCCISQSAKLDLLAFRSDLPAEQLIVTYLGAEIGQFTPIANAEMLQQVRANYGIPLTASYLLSVCTHLPHKNMPFAIRNFLELCAKQAIADDVVLVLCGGKRKFTKAMDDLLLQFPLYSHRVILTGYVADDDLPALYSGATTFILPSLYEGFGLPVLEAMQCGTPVLSSNTASLPEVGGDAALYASPTDDTQFQQQIVTLLNSPELRQRMVEKGFEQAKKFSWEQSAKETLAVYRQAHHQLTEAVS
jgi:glycosyltransferase involved in cell wall biosynthesis